MIGKPVPILDGIVRTPAAQFSVSDTGSLVYVPGGNQLSGQTLVWVDRDGKEEPLPQRFAAFPSPGSRPTAGRSPSSSTTARSGRTISRVPSLTPLTAADAQTNFPVWTPDGSRLAFSSNQDGALSMFWMPADGSGPAERLTTSVLFQDPSSFSPDGRLLVFVELDPSNAQDIWVLPMDPGRKPRPLLTTQFVEGGPMLSPDGQWLAFVSNESGDNEVYVRRFSGPAGRPESRATAARNSRGRRTVTSFSTAAEIA